jgi:hypothetical protein
MTHPLVKQVAQALCRASYPNADIEEPAMRWDHVDGVMMPTDQPMWTDYLDDARAAIAATLTGIREPSEAMVCAAIARPGPDDIHELLYFGVFRAMVDALRAELLPPPGDA